MFSREGCCLCHEALEVVRRARVSAEFELEVVDVDSDPALAARYGEEVPVIEIDGRKAFKYRLTEKAFLGRLGRPRFRSRRA